MGLLKLKRCEISMILEVSLQRSSNDVSGNFWNFFRFGTTSSAQQTKKRNEHLHYYICANTRKHLDRCLHTYSVTYRTTLVICVMLCLAHGSQRARARKVQANRTSAHQDTPLCSHKGHSSAPWRCIDCHTSHYRIHRPVRSSTDTHCRSRGTCSLEGCHTQGTGIHLRLE